MTSGYFVCTFDLLNVRDLDLIAQAKALCDHLTIGVFDDECALQVRGRPPIIPLHERLVLVSHLRGVDRVVVHSARPTMGTGEDQLIFVAYDEIPPGPPSDQRVVLHSNRESTSWMLQAALQPHSDSAVA